MGIDVNFNFILSYSHRVSLVQCKYIIADLALVYLSYSSIYNFFVRLLMSCRKEFLNVIDPC